jgi:hypothetical protein
MPAAWGQCPDNFLKQSDSCDADLLLSCLSALHEQLSLIVTTTAPFAEWAILFGGDQRLTAALLDSSHLSCPCAPVLGQQLPAAAQSQAPGGGSPGTANSTRLGQPHYDRTPATGRARFERRTAVIVERRQQSMSGCCSMVRREGIERHDTGVSASRDL